MNFAVVGAGPTGVELAGALAEIGRFTVARDFRTIDPTRVRVVLVEGADRVLPSYPPVLSAKAQSQLESLGVEVRTGERVTEIDHAGRVRVSQNLTIPQDPCVFVVGDLMALEYDDKTVPGVAPTAAQAGRYVGRAITARLANRELDPFRYRDKGPLATIGRSAAVTDLGRLRFSGHFAWLFWWVIHIFLLIGFRSRFLVFFG